MTPAPAYKSATDDSYRTYLCNFRSKASKAWKKEEARKKRCINLFMANGTGPSVIWNTGCTLRALQCMFSCISLLILLMWFTFWFNIYKAQAAKNRYYCVQYMPDCLGQIWRWISRPVDQWPRPNAQATEGLYQKKYKGAKWWRPEITCWLGKLVLPEWVLTSRRWLLGWGREYKIIIMTAVGFSAVSLGREFSSLEP